MERRFSVAALALTGMRPPRFGGLFETFASVIPFQQLSLDAGVAIVGRLVERFGEHLEYGDRRFHAFPKARAVAHARLRALRDCGLSRSKAESLRYVAGAIESGELTEKALTGMSTSDALERLTALPGIGPRSASVVLLSGLGRLDVFPPGDVGAERELGASLRLRTRKAFSDAVEHFGGLRGYLYFLGIGVSLVRKDLIHAATE